MTTIRVDRKTWARLLELKARWNFSSLQQVLEYIIFDEGYPKKTKGTTTVQVSDDFKEKLRGEVDVNGYDTFNDLISAKIARKV